MLIVVLTGGPCAGKSTALDILKENLETRGYKIITVPEGATKLITSGIMPDEVIGLENFQEFVLEEQLKNEEMAIKAAQIYEQNGIKTVIILDRGIGDQMAYISREKFGELLAKRGMSLADVDGRYDCVLSLVTAADGAEEHYQWANPDGDKGNNAARTESPEEAREKDKLTQQAWIGCSHLRVIDNSTDFNEKMKRVLKEIFSALGEPVPTEIERKFLIKMPSAKTIEELGCVSECSIIQTYLQSDNPEVERRVRQRGIKGIGYNFYYTEKKPVAYGEREENERRITWNEYVNYLVEADTNLHQISKTRYCFLYDRKYYEMDIYPFSNEYAILEIELNDINEELNLPPLEIVKEVTDDKSYKNHTLACTMTLQL